MHALRLISMLAAGLVSAVPALAVTVVPAGAIWQYSFAEPGAGWQTGADAGVAWQSGPAPFGNCGQPGVDCLGFDPLFVGQTPWPEDTSGLLADDLWVRRTIDLSDFDPLTQTLQWNLGVDNGYALYVNGVLLSQDNAEGFTFRWEYTGAVPASMLVAGDNWIAVALEDHGELTAFDMEITTGATPPPVPEPASILLWLGGLGLVPVLNRRRAPR